MGKVAVLGLGASVGLFEPAGFDLAIGVNDIWRHYPAEEVVCLDYPRAFNPGRLQVINASRPRRFYSQIVDWDVRPDYQQITLLPGYPDRHIDLKLGLYKSFCSPFVAVQLAYTQHGAGEIHLYGVDLVNHPHLDHQLCERIKVHFMHLFKYLVNVGVNVRVHGNGILTV